MRMKGKKVIFNIKDTYSLCDTLDRVIHVGLVKFKEIITNPEFPMAAGTPCIILNELFPDAGNEFTEEQSKEGCETWLSYIDKMIYAFENKVPDIGDYDFTYISDVGDGDEVEGGFVWNKKPDNPQELDRYNIDTDKHNDDVRCGLDLFSKYHDNLWW